MSRSTPRIPGTCVARRKTSRLQSHSRLGSSKRRFNFCKRRSTMMIQHRTPVNVPALLHSIHRFVEELEIRNDPIEIKDWEWTMWDLSTVHELRRTKVPAPNLPR